MNQAKHILVTAPLGVGGITSMMINIQKNIDRNKINFDYLVLHDRHEDLEDVVIKMGSKKLIASADEISNKWLRGFVRWYRLYRVFKDNDIKVLHLNGGPASDMTTVFIAKLAGVKHVTFHSHNAGNAVYRNKISVAMSKIFKLFMPVFVDEFWACSSLAAQFSFPKSIVKNQKYKFIPNGIALEKFSYNVSLGNVVYFYALVSLIYFVVSLVSPEIIKQLSVFKALEIESFVNCSVRVTPISSPAPTRSWI